MSVSAAEAGRRKQVRLRMRPNLVFVREQGTAGESHTLKDPVTLAYFRLDAGQRFVVGLLDGSHTLEDVRRKYEEAFRPERLSPEELEAFAVQLLESGLAQNESPQTGRLLFERARKQQAGVLRSALLNFLYIKVPLFDPDPLLTRLAPLARFAFGPAGLTLGLGAILAALALVATQWNEFTARLPGYEEFFTAHNLLYLWVAVGVAKVFHELGHGLCCKAQGGEVREAGVLFLLFVPTLYCDASDSWALPGKWRRMAVAAAGIYADLLTAVAATVVWWLADSHSLIHHLCFGLMVACTVNTVVWNANPLMRFDGYYALSDWLEVPNLADRSSAFVRRLCLGWLGLEASGEPWPARPVILGGYALASYAYRAVVMVALVHFLGTALRPYKLGVVGVALAAAAVFAALIWPAWGVVRAVYDKGRLPDMFASRLWLAAGVAGFVAVAVFLIPLPMRVGGRALVQVDPDHVRPVVVPGTGGALRSLRVRDGQRARAGDVLAVLDNPKLEIQIRVNEADRALRSQQVRSQSAALAEGNVSEDRLAEGFREAETELRSLEREHATLRELKERLTLRAPCDGVLLGLLSPEAVGKWLEPGDVVCRVGDPNALRAVLLVEPADRTLVGPGSRAWLRVHGRGASSWSGTVTDVAAVDAKKIPPELGQNAGGEVATQADAASGLERPRDPHYLLAVRVEADRATHPGVLGRVSIETSPRTCWWRVHRYLAKTFNWGL